MRHLMLVLLLLLGACTVLSPSDMPDLDDVDSIRAAVVKLDPVAPGGTPRADSIYGNGQPGSDRNLFVQWLIRYANEDAARRTNIDYVPAVLPPTIAAAIEEQRKYAAADAKDREEGMKRIRAEAAQEQAHYQDFLRQDNARKQEISDGIAASRRDQVEQAEINRAAYKECDRQRSLERESQPADTYASYRQNDCEARFPSVVP